MRVISKKSLDEYSAQYPDVEMNLLVWYRRIKSISPGNIGELRETFGHADPLGIDNQYTCFNIKGNHYRLITKVMYTIQRVYIVELLTHSEYNRKYTKGRKK